MHSRELTIGRTLGVTFDHGEGFFETLTEFCRPQGIRQGYIPMFLAGFEEAEIVGTCEKLEDPNAPVWAKVHLENVEAVGCGTIAYDPENDQVSPHIHTSLGIKGHGATAHTSHLLSARVLFLVEMLLIEVASPAMHRQPNPDLYDVPLLTFEA
ncbi:MAG: PPC domain-containing DNA-binding protein [Solirubrobacteraceae bacterium]